MNIGELERFAKYTKQLTDNDIVKAKNLVLQGKYVKLLKYMLVKNVKLEQEIIALHNSREIGII